MFMATTYIQSINTKILFKYPKGVFKLMRSENCSDQNS